MKLSGINVSAPGGFLLSTEGFMSFESVVMLFCVVWPASVAGKPVARVGNGQCQ